MNRIDNILAFDFANERRGDVFTIEFPNRWDARAARRAAELHRPREDRPSISQRALAKATALGLGSRRNESLIR